MSKLATTPQSRTTPVIHGFDALPVPDIPHLDDLISRTVAATMEHGRDRTGGAGRKRAARHPKLSAEASAEFSAMVEQTSQAVSIVLEAVLAGSGFKIFVSDDSVLTSQDAADLLNVSRPYVVKLARTGVLPHTLVGTHRRFTARDVLELRERMRAERADALTAISPPEGYEAGDF